MSLNKSSPPSIGYFFFTKSSLFSSNIYSHSVYLLPCFRYPNFGTSIKCVVKDFSSSAFKYGHGPSMCDMATYSVYLDTLYFFDILLMFGFLLCFASFNAVSPSIVFVFKLVFCWVYCWHWVWASFLLF